MEYTKDLEQVRGIQKKWLGKEGTSQFLLFVPIEGTEKYEFCSPDEKLQTWCENVKTKKIKGNQIMRVVEGARQAMKSPQPIQVKASTKTMFSENPIGWVQEQCQAKGMETPEYETVDTVQGGGLSLVTVEAYAGWLDDPLVARGERSKDAKKLIARKIAEMYFPDELEKELSENNKQSNQKSENKSKTQPQGKAHSIEDSNQLKHKYNQYRWDINPIGAMQEYCQQNGLSLPNYRETQDTVTLAWTEYMTLEGINHKFVGVGKSVKEAKIQAIAKYLDALRKGKIEDTKPIHNKGMDKIDIHTEADAGFYVVNKGFYAVDDNGNVCRLANKDSKPRFLGKGLWLDFDEKNQRSTLVKNNTPIVSYDFKKYGGNTGYGSARYFAADGEPITKEVFDKVITDTFAKDGGNYVFSKAQSLQGLEGGQVLKAMRQAKSEEVLEFVELDMKLAEATSRCDYTKYESIEREDLMAEIDEILDAQKEIFNSFGISKPKQSKSSLKTEQNNSNNPLAFALKEALGRK